MGHLIKDRKTYWTYLNGEFGIVTDGEMYTKNLDFERRHLYFKSVEGNIYCSGLLDYNYISGYTMLHSSEAKGYTIDCSCKCSDWAKGFIANTITTYNEIREIENNCKEGVKYLLEKCIDNGIMGNSDLYDIIRVWYEHPEMELLVASGNWRLGMNKSFWKLTDKKKKAVVSWLKNNPSGKTLGYILDEINGKDHALREVSERYKVPYGVTQHYIDHLTYIEINMLHDYYKMCRRLKKNLKDKYWLMPKDFLLKHSKLVEEIYKIEETKRQARIREKNEKLIKLVESLKKYDFEQDGYSVFVAPNVEEIILQATTLHQCLMSCSYDQKMIDKNCILVFIRKENKPIATMEINKSKKIGQFYMDEKDRDNCLPTPEIRALGQKWLDNYLAA